jgi:polyhydroxybutyrate depolymerase
MATCASTSSPLRSSRGRFGVALAPEINAGSDASDPYQTLQHDGIDRHYLIRTPAESALRVGSVPLVLVLHGGGGNADNAERMTGFTAKAQREGFIVVYPEGSSRFRQKLLTWNAGHCCGYAMEHKVDDVGFIRSLIQQLLEQYPIDPARVYVTGMSNGGMMTHRLGRELAGQVAAIAPVVATVFGDESRAGQPVSALMFNGMRDESVPYLGGAPSGRFNDAWDGTPAKPALDQGVYWAAGKRLCKGTGQTGSWQPCPLAVCLSGRQGCRTLSAQGQRPCLAGRAERFTPGRSAGYGGECY